MKTVKRNSKLITNVTLDSDFSDIRDELHSVKAYLIHNDIVFSELNVRQSGDHTFNASKVLPSDTPIGEHIVQWKFRFKDQSEPIIENEVIEVIRDLKSHISVGSKMMKEKVLNQDEIFEELPSDIVSLLRGIKK